MAKYGNRKTEVDGFLFDSLAEAARYSGLKLMEFAKEIDGLELQPKYPIDINGKHICNYFADFRYWDYATGAYVIEDVKGVKTAVYKLKKRLVEAQYDIKIVEVE
jgi:hypothetical protein